MFFTLWGNFQWFGHYNLLRYSWIKPITSRSKLPQQLQDQQLWDPLLCSKGCPFKRRMVFSSVFFTWWQVGWGTKRWESTQKSHLWWNRDPGGEQPFNTNASWCGPWHLDFHQKTQWCSHLSHLNIGQQIHDPSSSSFRQLNLEAKLSIARWGPYQL